MKILIKKFAIVIAITLAVVAINVNSVSATTWKIGCFLNNSFTKM